MCGAFTGSTVNLSCSPRSITPCGPHRYEIPGTWRWRWWPLGYSCIGRYPQIPLRKLFLRWVYGTYFAYALGGLGQADQRAWFRLEEKRAVPNGTDPYPRLKI